MTRAFAAGESVGRYRLLQSIGAGAMGRVYEAYDPLLDRTVAIKVPKPGNFAVRLRAEARALARVGHPNVVAVHDVGELEGHTFVVLELVDGMTLDAWLMTERRTIRAILDVVLAAGRGLAAVHAAGLLHRDFKPHNVVVGNDGRVRVVDLSIASDSAADSGLEGTVLGTPAYMAPEQRAGKTVNAQADQFSFCVVLWEALFEERPYRKDEFVKLVRGDRNARISAPSLSHRAPLWLRQLLQRGLDVDPLARHASMTTLLDTIERQLALANEPTV